MMQTIRGYFWVIWGFLLSPICQAQIGLDTLYKIQDGVKVFTHMYPYNNDSALLLCTATDFNSPDSLRYEHILIFHLYFQNGKIRQMNKIQVNNRTCQTMFVRYETDSNNFIYFGTKNQTNSKVYLAKRQGNWDSILTTPLAIPLSNYSISSGQRIGAGYVFTGNTGFFTTSPTYIAFFDKQFQLRRFYTYPFSSSLYSLTSLTPNRFILSGGYTPPDATSASRLYNLCIDSMGKIIWEKFHSGYQNNDINYYLDKDVYYQNKLYQYGVVTNNGYLIAAMNIVDTTGTILKECRYPMGYSTSFNKIIEYRGSLYGLCLIDTVFPGDSVLDQCMALMKINPENGEVIWTQRYRHWSRMNGMYNIYAINNQLYLLGYAINPKRLAEMDSINQVQPDAWLLSVDTNGCVLPGCNPVVNGVTHYLLDDDDWINIYPNPAGKQFTVSFHESFKPGTCQIYLYDATGKQLMQQTYTQQPKEITLQHNSTYSGMAYLVISTVDGNFYRKIMLK